MKVEKGEIVEKAMAIGTIQPYKEIQVKSKISGIVRKLYVEIGDSVKEGALLLDISPQPTPIGIYRSQARGGSGADQFRQRQDHL